MVRLELSLVLWLTVFALSARTPVSKAVMKGGMGSSFLGIPVRKLSFSLPSSLPPPFLPPSLPSFLPSFHVDRLTFSPKATQLTGGGTKLEAQT